MTQTGERPGFCLAVIRSSAATPRSVARTVSRSLRRTDSVLVQAGAVVAAIVGDEAGAHRAVDRVREAEPVLGITAEVVSARHPAFTELNGAMRRIPPLASRPVVPSAADAGRTATAVLVDDHPEVRSMLAQLVSRAGWTAVVPEPHDDIVEVCRASDAEVLVADYHLGGGFTGVDVSLACRRAGLGMPVILFTASGWATAAEDTTRVGAIVISKGQIEELLAALDRLAERLRMSHRRHI